MILHVTAAEHREGYHIRVEFDDGVVKDVDLEGELTGPIFKPLRDPAFFRRFRVKEAIGDATKAGRWLRSPNRALQGKCPLDLLDSDIGARMVEQVLGRIEHGLVA